MACTSQGKGTFIHKKLKVRKESLRIHSITHGGSRPRRPIHAPAPLGRQAGLKQQSYDSVPDLQNTDSRQSETRLSPGSSGYFDSESLEPWLRRRPPNHEQRLSLLTDIDLNGCDLQLETPPTSAQSTYRGRPHSYRLNSDVFFMSPGSRNGSVRDQSDRFRYSGSSAATPTISSTRSVLTPAGSFRSSHLFNSQKNSSNRLILPPEKPIDPVQVHNYRDRSQSDVYKSDRLNWLKLQAMNRRPNYMAQATKV